jgi:hypothetical protein
MAVASQITSRSQDSYIQLKSFKGEPGKRFTIAIGLGDISVKEEADILSHFWGKVRKLIKVHLLSICILSALAIVIYLLFKFYP